MYKDLFENSKNVIPDDETCLNWLVSQRYPNGIECPTCKKVTKHHKVSKRSCYACDVCGHHEYPTAGTIFHKSHIPLRIWFQVMQEISTSDFKITAKEIQRKYGVNHKTSNRMIQKIKEFLNKNDFSLLKINGEKTYLKDQKSSFNNWQKGEKSAVEILRSKAKENQVRYYNKRDRTARLLKLEMLLAQYPDGLTISEIASKCSVSNRTSYRDLKALEQELDVPIWENNKKRGIMEGYNLPPIHFTTDEAMRIFLSIRLLLNYSHVYDPASESVFMKLNSIVNHPLKQQIQSCLEYMRKQPKNEEMLLNLSKLTEAWLSKRRVSFNFQEISDEKPIERKFEIYFIEPGLWGHSTILIGYCNYKKSICVYKTDRIVGRVHIEQDMYEVPRYFDPLDYLESIWTLHKDEELITAKLYFSPKISKLIEKTIWHPSQKIQYQNDGSIIMTLKVRDTSDLRAWLLEWDYDIEILEPANLRERMARTGKILQDIYARH